MLFGSTHLLVLSYSFWRTVSKSFQLITDENGKHSGGCFGAVVSIQAIWNISIQGQPALELSKTLAFFATLIWVTQRISSWSKTLNLMIGDRFRGDSLARKNQLRYVAHQAPGYWSRTSGVCNVGTCQGGYACRVGNLRTPVHLAARTERSFPLHCSSVSISIFARFVVGKWLPLYKQCCFTWFKNRYSLYKPFVGKCSAICYAFYKANYVPTQRKLTRTPEKCIL